MSNRCCPFCGREVVVMRFCELYSVGCYAMCMEHIEGMTSETHEEIDRFVMPAAGLPSLTEEAAWESWEMWRKVFTENT